MTTLSIMALLILSFSGSLLLFLLLEEAIRGKSPVTALVLALYASYSAIAIIETAFIAAYRFEDLHLLMAKNEDISGAILYAMLLVKDAARCASLFAAAGLVTRLLSKKPEWKTLLPPAAWSVAFLAYRYGGMPFPRYGYLAPVFDLAYAFIGIVYALRYLRERPARDAVDREARFIVTIAVSAFIPLKLALSGIDAFVPAGLSPYFIVYPDLLFFFALNCRAYRCIFVSGFRLGHPGTNRSAVDPAGIADFLGSCGLSSREREIAGLLADHASYKRMADALCISVDTVKSHAKAVYRKTGCANRLELIARSGNHPSFTPETGALRASPGKNHPDG